MKKAFNFRTALDTGKTLIYKGNEYFLDIKL